MASADRLVVVSFATRFSLQDNEEELACLIMLLVLLLLRAATHNTALFIPLARDATLQGKLEHFQTKKKAEARREGSMDN